MTSLALLGDVKEFRQPSTSEQAAARAVVWEAQKIDAPVQLTADQVAALWASVLADTAAFLRAVDALARERAEADRLREKIAAIREAVL